MTSTASVFAFLLRRTLAGAARRRLARLREPRYLLGAIVGALYMYFWLGRAMLRNVTNPHVLGPRLQVSPEALALFLSLAAAALAVNAALLWVFQTGRPVLHVSEADVQFLAPAPLPRQALLYLSLLRTTLGIGFGALVMAVLRPRLRASLLAGVRGGFRRLLDDAAPRPGPRLLESAPGRGPARDATPDAPRDRRRGRRRARRPSPGSAWGSTVPSESSSPFPTPPPPCVLSPMASPRGPQASYRSFCSRLFAPCSHRPSRPTRVTSSFRCQRRSWSWLRTTRGSSGPTRDSRRRHSKARADARREPRNARVAAFTGRPRRRSARSCRSPCRPGEA